AALGLSACAGGQSNASEKSADEASEEAAKEEEQRPPVEVAILERGPIEAVLRFSTDLEAEESVPVHSQSPSLRRVVQLLVEEGDRVARGQLLAKLQDDEQRHAVAKVGGQLEKVRADHDRQKQLFEQQLISEQTLTETRHQLEQLEIELADTRQALAHTEVRAPIAGTVTQRAVKLGDPVTMDQPLFQIVDFDSLVARVYVPEREMARVRAGQPARLTSQALPGVVFAGVVDRVAPVIDPKSGTVKVTVRVPHREGLLPGMFLEVQLVTDVRADALLLPKRALVLDHDQAWVYRLQEDGTVERLLVLPLLEDARHVEVRQGLEAGDRVVVAGQAGLKPGTKVRVIGGEARGAA
ncbi:MAG TPA: efflux RND transporter periplasmic adaptor subunit, partial [Thermoanaerobaculia bacterium]|nr:efflux RND transporter periplasmic adaptor subunit [Thermoanaerobaculia bacterium]